MNIFYTDSDPIIAARNLCNVHVNKMIIESAQMLSTAHHVLDNKDAIKGIMKPTHVNHPSNVWVRASKENYEWLLSHLIELLKIFEMRSGKIHACVMRIPFLVNLPDCISTRQFTEPPRAMPDHLKNDVTITTEEAYRLYLCEKYTEWQQRERPMRVVFFHDEPTWYSSYKILHNS